MELSQSPDLLRHIPPTAIPASRLVSSDQLPRRASAQNPTSATGATPTISCPYYKSELYIVSEEQAFRSQHGRPFRNDDVADCIAIASSTPPNVTVPHRSYLRTPNVTVRGQLPSQQPEFVMRHSYSGRLSPSSASYAMTSSTPVTASASYPSSFQHSWPTSTNKQSVTESKWKWLHSNAMVQQPSPISLRRATQLDIPSTAQLSSSALRQDPRQQSAGNLTMPVSDSRLADTQDQARASRLYYSKPVVDYSTPGEQPQRRKTTLDLIQSVSDVHRSVGDQSVRHWRHSSDNTARRSTTDPASRRWDNYGLTLSLSGAAVPVTGQTLGNDAMTLDLDRNTNGHTASSTGDLPQKLPIERIMRFENSDVLDSSIHPPSAPWHPKDIATATALPSAATKHSTSSENDSLSLVSKSGRSGWMSVPDSIPIYFRAESSAMQSQPSISRLETKAGRSESVTVPYLTDGPQQPSSLTSSQSASCGMYMLVLGTINTVCLF